MKILIVDDDADLLALVAFALTQAGYAVVKAGDAPVALRVFEAEAPDLAILDINLPTGSGFDVCRAIRAVARPGDDAHRAQRGGGPRQGARPRGGRLPHQAVQPAHAAGARQARCCAVRALEAGDRWRRAALRLDLEAHSAARSARPSRDAPHQARDAADADPAGERRPRGRHRDAAGARLGTARQRRPAAAQAAGAPPAAEDRGRPSESRGSCRTESGAGYRLVVD
jgi:CheY-like chemotaxis protein